MNKTTFNKSPFFYDKYNNLRSQFVTSNLQQCFSSLCYENNLINIEGYMWIN
jgi:hypothetical protein